MKYYTHVKSGRRYMIMEPGEVQISTDLKDGDRVIIYASIDDPDAPLFVRKEEEFHDGRFREI